MKKCIVLGILSIIGTVVSLVFTGVLSALIAGESLDTITTAGLTVFNL